MFRHYTRCNMTPCDTKSLENPLENPVFLPKTAGAEDQKGEFYTSGVIAAMIARGAPFRGMKLRREDFHVLGTPSQVAEWCGSWRTQPKRRFLFDLQGALVTQNGQAIERNVRLCRALKKQGHHVAIWTDAWQVPLHSAR